MQNLLPTGHKVLLLKLLLMFVMHKRRTTTRAITPQTNGVVKFATISKENAGVDLNSGLPKTEVYIEPITKQIDQL